jgi:hypothetical protein
MSEIFLGCILVMLIGLICMGYNVRRALYRSQKAFESFAETVTNYSRIAMQLNVEIAVLKERVSDLELAARGVEAQTPYPQDPLN